MQENMIPARYIGDTEIVLGHYGGPYKDGDGKPLTDLVLRKGDTLMMRESEVNGLTVKFDPRGVNDPEILGVGRVVLPEDTDVPEDELFLRGYQFHQGREDFEPVEAVNPDASASDQAPAK